MAIGILMTRHGLTEDLAFDALRQQSSRRNVKLLTLAEGVIYAGGLEPADARPIPSARAGRRAGRPSRGL
jgi:hypothetical protein